MDIQAGSLTVLYLFEVADQVDLLELQRSLGGASGRLSSKSIAPAYLQYHTPPLVIDGHAVGVAALDGFSVRFKFFEYGVVSMALVQPFSGTWPQLVGLAQRYVENPELEVRAEHTVRRLVERCATVFTHRRDRYLVEDYLMVAVHGAEGITSAEQLLAEHGPEVAQLVRGEAQPLSRQEQEEVFRNRLSYFASDVVVATWNAAFVFDTDAGAAAALELLEFANSQLLEFRYYDALLDAELARIYPSLQRTNWWRNLLGGGSTKAANQLHSLFIDVTQLTDRTENALKIVGDIYAARVYGLVGARLGLGRWKQSVEDKLKTLDDIYRFAVEQVTISRGQFLELTVVLILVIELILFFLGIMKP